jgi:hypothetical protein
MTYKELSRIAVKLAFLAVKNVTRATNSFGLSDDVQRALKHCSKVGIPCGEECYESYELLRII